MTVAAAQRYTRRHRCPICDGAESDPRGRGRRCAGYASTDGRYAHCSRADHAGVLAVCRDGTTYAHRLDGPCLCGVTHGTAPLEIDAAAIERRAAEIDRDRAERERLLAEMPCVWETLDRRSLVGERYLAGRGIDPAALRLRGDLVRYRSDGAPAVAARDLATGAITGIQYRQLGGAEPKVITARGSRLAGSALVGRVAELDREGVDVAVVAEGLADTLAAHLAFPGCAIFGAAGCGQLGRVAAAVAPRLREIRGWLLVVPHDDDEGVRGAADAVCAAREAGLVLDRDLHLVDLGSHQDLADAWRAGWRWPIETGGAA